jgi:hypothetical protein
MKIISKESFGPKINFTKPVNLKLVINFNLREYFNAGKKPRVGH